jgi:hypothetical protein
MSTKPRGIDGNVDQLFSLNRLHLLRVLQHRLPRFARVDEVLEQLQRDWPEIFGQEAAPKVSDDLTVRLDQVEIENMQLRAGLLRNRRIGAACGILMASLKITYEAAFERLALASSDANRKVIDIAEDVIMTGQLPSRLASQAGRFIPRN